MSGLNLILKITERCNLNYSYCYYFNGLDQSFRNNPPLMSLGILEEVIKFILQGIKELKIKRLAVILHGGEPLLMPKSQFSSICNKLYQSLAPVLDEFSLRLQTNGVLINDHWIDIFSEYKVKISISLDGPAQYHDEFQVDHRARGSHVKVLKAIELLQKKQVNFGILSVVNPSYDPVVIYNYFTKTLGITGFNFLLPDCTHDHLPPYPAEEYGKFITAIFDEWIKQDNERYA